MNALKEVRSGSTLYLVSATEIIGTDATQFSAWERTDGWMSTKHSSLTTFGREGYDGVWGRVASRKVNRDTAQQMDRDKLFQYVCDQKRLASAVENQMICRAFPEARDAAWEGGFIVA